MNKFFLLIVAFFLSIIICFAFKTQAKTVTVPDVLSVVETMATDCGTYKCFGSIEKIYDQNNNAVCYKYHYEGNSMAAGDVIALSCVK